MGTYQNFVRKSLLLIAPLVFVIIFVLIPASSAGALSLTTIAQTNPVEAVVDAAEDTVEAVEAVGTCDEKAGDFSFFLCPVLKGVNNGVELLDRQVRRSLEVKPVYYENDQIKEAWGRIRNIAYVLLIPIMLVMVIGTALGFSFVSAYTVKRAMPRLLIAVIFMALSFDICVIMIDVTTALGRGVGGIIAQPFGGMQELTLDKIFNPTLGNDAVALGGGLLIGIPLLAVGFVSISILASYLGVAALSLLIIFALLTVRELVIVFLLIMSPVAILSWIFPGKDKLWGLWWNSFSKLLMIYPIIIGLLVTGRAFAFLTGSIPSEGLESVFIVLVKLTAYIGPFFFIPSAFKMAGGAFANLAGVVNDKGKGAFDRQRQFRGNKRKQLKERAQAGNRWQGSGALSKAASRGAMYGTNAHHAFDSGINPKGFHQNIKNSMNNSEHANLAKVKEENGYFNAIEKDDNVLAASLKGSDSAIRESLIGSGDSRFTDEGVLNATVQQIKAAKAQSGAKVFEKAAVQSLAASGTHFKNAAHMAQTINDVYGDDRQNAGSAMMMASNASLGAGRIDLGGASAGAKLGTLTSLYNGQDSNGNAFDGNDLNRIVSEDVIDNSPASSLAHASMKAGYLESNIMPAMRTRLQKAYSSGDQGQIDAELATVQNIQDALTQSSPNVAKVFADGMMEAKMGVMPVSVHEHKESILGELQSSTYKPLPSGTAGPVAPKTAAELVVADRPTSDTARRDASKRANSTYDDKGNKYQNNELLNRRSSHQSIGGGETPQQRAAREAAGNDPGSGPSTGGPSTGL